jgi:hypothetical protein
MTEIHTYNNIWGIKTSMTKARDTRSIEYHHTIHGDSLGGVISHRDLWLVKRYVYKHDKKIAHPISHVYYMINRRNSMLNYIIRDVILCRFGRQVKTFCKNFLAVCIFREENTSNGFFQNICPYLKCYTRHSKDP